MCTHKEINRNCLKIIPGDIHIKELRTSVFKSA